MGRVRRYIRTENRATEGGLGGRASAVCRTNGGNSPANGLAGLPGHHTVGTLLSQVLSHLSPRATHSSHSSETPGTQGTAYAGPPIRPPPARSARRRASKLTSQGAQAAAAPAQATTAAPQATGLRMHQHRMHCHTPRGSRAQAASATPPHSASAAHPIHSPDGSTMPDGRDAAYRYQFQSPPANPIGSAVTHLPRSGL